MAKQAKKQNSKRKSGKPAKAVKMTALAGGGQRPEIADPIFAAIDRHAKMYKEYGRALDARSRLEVGGGPNKPGFAAADRRVDKASDGERDALYAICNIRPTSPEGAAAAAIYLRERYIEDDSPCVDVYEKSLVDGFVRMTRAFASRQHSAEFKRVMALVDAIKAERAKRSRKWRKSAKAKWMAEKVKKITSGPTTIEVVTEAKTLRKIADIVTLMVPKDADRAIAMVEKKSRKRQSAKASAHRSAGA